MLVHLPVDHPTAAEAALFARPFTDTGVGFAVGPRLLTRAGAAIVATLRRFGPVFADARLSGDPASVAGAARILAAAGAGRISVGPGSGPALVRSVVDAVSSRHTITVAVIVGPEADDSDIEVATAGAGRGRTTSRVAAELSGIAAIEVLGVASDLGVVAQVAPDLGVLVGGIGDVAAAGTVRDRGAAGIVLVPGAVAGPESLAPYLDADG